MLPGALLITLGMMASVIAAMEIITLSGTGTDGGKACVIPWTYNSVIQYGCSYNDKKVAWCPTSSNIEKWGQCPDTAPGSFPARLPRVEIDNKNTSVLPPYNRDDWNHWTTKNCRTTRTWVLLDENVGNITFTSTTSCAVASGLWYDVYTPKTTKVPLDLDIDHMIPLENAHISGGWAWSKEKKELFANDRTFPEHLLAVGKSPNRAKGSRPPSEWKPPNTAWWCEYAVRWISIKARWALTITTPEESALSVMLTSCPVDVPWNNTLMRAPSVSHDPVIAFEVTATGSPLRSTAAFPPAVLVTVVVAVVAMVCLSVVVITRWYRQQRIVPEAQPLIVT